MQRFIERPRHPEADNGRRCKISLLGRGTVFLRNLFPLAGERPFAVEGLRLFANSFGNLIYLEVFEDVHTEFARAGKIDIAVMVEIGGDELRAGTSCAVN